MERERAGAARVKGEKKGPGSLGRGENGGVAQKTRDAAEEVSGKIIGSGIWGPG